MKALLGRKIGMSQIFSDEGDVIPVTLISAERNSITLRRTEAKDGYVAAQLALPRRRSNDTKDLPQRGKPKQMKRHFALRQEFHGTLRDDVQEVGVDQFIVGDIVQVSGLSKGKGFAGVVKRHHFKGGPASHGHRHVLRRPGSIGSRFPQHVRKGKRMAGRMGHDRVTVKNLQIVSIDTEHHVLAVKGAVPGARGS
ncbi:MAG: 50S ribosomal protein L3, partial [Candidatus Binatia bacterium]